MTRGDFYKDWDIVSALPHIVLWVECPEEHHHLNRSCTWWSFQKTFFPHLYLYQYNKYLKTSHFQSEGNIWLGKQPQVFNPIKTNIQSTCCFPSTVCCALAGRSPYAAGDMRVPTWDRPFAGLFRPLEYWSFSSALCVWWVSDLQGLPSWGMILPCKCCDQYVEQKAVICHFSVFSWDFTGCHQSPQIVVLNRRIWDSIDEWLFVPEVRTAHKFCSFWCENPICKKERN